MDNSLSDLQLIREHCVELFTLPDFVMENQAISTLLAFFQAGGQPEQVVDLLAMNYNSISQLSNLFGCWLADLDQDVQPSTSYLNYLTNAKKKIENNTLARECFETTIINIIVKSFCTESADKIFEMEDSEGIDWLPELVSHLPWRRLIYQLAEHYPNCLMLNFAVKLISDAGFQHEISNVNTAAQQLDIFSRVFLSSVENLLIKYSDGVNNELYQTAFYELARVACHSDQTFLYTQALLHLLSKKETGKISAACTHISQSLCLDLKQKGQNVSAVNVALLQSNVDPILSNIVQAMLTMIAKRELNPADIFQLYQVYFDLSPPTITLIQDPLFMDMLIDALFNLNRPKIYSEHRVKYIYLLAYTASVCEFMHNGILLQSKVDFELTRKQIEEIVSILHDPDIDLLSSLQPLLRLLKLPILGAGLLHFIKTSVIRDVYSSEPLSVYFVLIDQIATYHSNLHTRIFNTLCQLYDHQALSNDVAEIIIQRQKHIIDRFVHLLICGYTVCVIERITKMLKDGQIDASLVRYFGSEVIEIINPPYSEEFLRAFLPLISNSEVFDETTIEKNLKLKIFNSNINVVSILKINN